MKKYKYVIAVLVVSLFFFVQALCQVNLPIYISSGGFMPLSHQKGALKINYGYTVLDNQGQDNIGISYSFKENLNAKMHYTRNANIRKLSPFSRQNEIQLSLGFYKYFENKPYNNFSIPFLDRIRKNKNEKREAMNRNKLFRKKSAFIFESNLNYSFARINSSTEVPTFKSSIENYSIDVVANILLKKRIDFVFFARTGFMNFGKVKLFNPSSFVITGYEQISEIDPILYLGYGWKLNWTFTYFDFYFKNEYKRFAKSFVNIHGYIQSDFAIMGLSFNLNEIFKNKMKSNQ